MHKSHFKGKDASSHIQEVQADLLGEAHGTESPGHKAAFADAVREVAFLLLLFFALLFPLSLDHSLLFLVLTAFSVGLIFWKTGRSGWLGWVRLERLHRLIEQERYEIEHHREQEREELIALYTAKGFEGNLLEQVVDHLMNDSDRLLKVMIEEELGLHLEAFEHPLKQAWGAFLGSLTSALIFLLGFFVMPFWGTLIAAGCSLSAGAILTAYTEKNRILNALIWTLSLATLSSATAYFLGTS